MNETKNMSINPSVAELVKFGPLPSSETASEAQLDSLQSLLEKIEEPVTDDDARALIQLFGPDECFGLAWELVHKIETAPSWPLWDVLNKQAPHGEWVEFMKTRAKNALA